MDRRQYSVLMSVHAGEAPDFLRQSIESILRQTLPTDDFVLVCDGPLTAGLDAVIRDFPQLRVVRLPRHMGIAAALNEGLSRCRHEFVARMDSDDISLPHRCRLQLEHLLAHPQTAILSAAVMEFEESPAAVTGQRVLPSDNGDILRFSKKRNPFNHPAVMYRKSAVIHAGGYFDRFPGFEDYDLWVRMLRAGSRGENLREPVLYMRAGDALYRRRRGPKYALNLLLFHRELRRCGWSTTADFLSAALPHAVLCLLPLPLLRRVYRRLHR